MKRSLSSFNTFKTPHFKPLDILPECTSTFRTSYFIPQQPVLLPRGHFRDYPAKEKWFTVPSPTSPSSPSSRATLKYNYLEGYGDCQVPLELTSSASNPPGEETFKRFYAPLSLFLQWTQQALSTNTTSTHDKTRLYLAQCQLLDLPSALRPDFPTPPLITQAGKGDIYDTNIWLGVPPTYTPLHRDPNPNLFVQLAGSKHVRLFPPEEGLRIFATVRGRLGKSGGARDAAFRGEDMMHGLEKEGLEREVWGQSRDGESAVDDGGVEGGGIKCEGYEALLDAGDAVFIPKGWWHSIKGVGEGITASVNWWFR